MVRPRSVCPFQTRELHWRFRCSIDDSPSRHEVIFFQFFLFWLGGAAWFPPPFGWSCCFSISFLRGAAFLLLPWVGLRSPSLLSGGAACSLPSFLGWCCLVKISPPKGEKEDHSTKGKTATPPKEGKRPSSTMQWRREKQNHPRKDETKQHHSTEEVEKVAPPKKEGKEKTTKRRGKNSDSF